VRQPFKLRRPSRFSYPTVPCVEGFGYSHSGHSSASVPFVRVIANNIVQSCQFGMFGSAQQGTQQMPGPRKGHPQLGHRSPTSTQTPDRNCRVSISRLLISPDRDGPELGAGFPARHPLHFAKLQERPGRGRREGGRSNRINPAEQREAREGALHALSLAHTTYQHSNAASGEARYDRRAFLSFRTGRIGDNFHFDRRSLQQRLVGRCQWVLPLTVLRQTPREYEVNPTNTMLQYIQKLEPKLIPKKIIKVK
jgi:hypothetical protein